MRARFFNFKIIFFTCCFFYFLESHAQLYEPIIVNNITQKKTGYYFLTLYKINFIEKKLNSLNQQCILNTLGEVVFFRKTIFGSDFKIHPNGLISYWHGNGFYLLNKELEIIDSVSCVNGISTDSHDFKILPNGHYLLCGKESEIKDLSNVHLYTEKHLPGSKRSIVEYDVIQELDKNKNLVFEWKTKPYFDIAYINTVYLTDTAKIDLTHFNSIDADSKGNILVSFRRFDELMKIDRKTGNIIWRMGGKYNQIKILNDSIPFLGQHDAQFTGENTISLFDNGYSLDSLKHNARGLEYEIDDVNKTAKLIWSYSNKNKIVSIATGSFKKHKNETALISYGKTNKEAINITCELLNNKSQIIQTISFKDTLGTYRAYFYTKLPFKLKQESIVISKKDSLYLLSTKQKYKYYLWSTGETTAEISVFSINKNHVFVSNDGINYTRSQTLK